MNSTVCMKKVEKMSPIFWPPIARVPTFLFWKKSHICIYLWQQQQLLFSFSQRRPALDWSSSNAQSCCHHLLQAAVLPLYAAVPCTRAWALLYSVFNSTSRNTLKCSWTRWVWKCFWQFLVVCKCNPTFNQRFAQASSWACETAKVPVTPDQTNNQNILF